MRRFLPIVLALGCDESGDFSARTDADSASPDEAAQPPVLSVSSEVVGVPNADDDDGNGKRDWLDRLVEDDERTSLAIDATGFSSLDLSLEDAAGVRVWRGETLLLSAERQAVHLVEPGLVELDVEFGEFGVETSLAVTAQVQDGESQASVVALRSGPLLLNHHLQPAEHVYAVKTSGWGGDNTPFVSPFRDSLGAAFTEVPGKSYDQDVWIQDEVEFATSTAPDARLDVAIDSIRDRGLDDFPEDYFTGPGTTARTWGRGWAKSQDSFGNMEVSPPVTVGGVVYPFGRIYYGVSDRLRPHPDLTDFLRAQALQAPFELDIGWLCVGHVDEFISFVPDATASKGFRLIYTDTTSAWTLLEAMDPATELPRYKGTWSGHGYGTIGEMLDDSGLRSYNDEIQAENLDPTLATLKTELGLDDGDVVLIPSLFEWACGKDLAAAMIPGMVNLTVVNFPNEPVRVFMADPFLRSDSDDQASDPLIAEVRSRLPGVELTFVDDWEAYHLGLGEVHCGTNVVRTPAQAWWEGP